MDALHEKYNDLKQKLLGMGGVAVAYSSGVDSTFLLKTAHDVLGDRAIAVTIRSGLFPDRELQNARSFCRREGIDQILVDIKEMEIKGFRENPKNRCYLCKKELFTRICQEAAARGIYEVAEGSNLDDMGDYRPGLMAVTELGIHSPLREAGLTKAEIRALSKELELPTWDKPSSACLASRFVYGETISEEKLRMVDRAEQLLLDLGFHQLRVRIHGTMARIEVLPEEFPKLISEEIRQRVNAELKRLGFSYVTMDLKGYRTGSMNETIL